ncbi:hypothetical protein CLOM_g19400 [Closterium sp. NIES-68]|nr:hypothetical protein CLOM_g19400 [Closterium sp. NIES-68]GJP76901.1 hypothetical protein CLOP_g7347 [Closterium sp. NIES-67]
MAQAIVNATSFSAAPFAPVARNGAVRLSSHASFSQIPTRRLLLLRTAIRCSRRTNQRISVSSASSNPADVTGRSGGDQASSEPTPASSPTDENEPSPAVSPSSSSAPSAPPSAPSVPSIPPSKPSSLLGLVLSAGPPGSWDSSGVGKAVVRRFASDNEERWFMWYEGWTDDTSADPTDGSDPSGDPTVPLLSRARTGVAVSANGLHWSRGSGVAETDAKGRGGPGMVLQPSTNWWNFDTRHVSVSDVMMMSSQKVRASGGVLWMFYVGGNAEELPIPARVLPLLPPHLAPSTPGSPSPARDFTEGEVVEGLRTRIGLAMSHDGRNWARIEGDHHSGAVMDVGAAGEWDELFHGGPQIVFHEAGDIRLFYHSLDRSGKGGDKETGGKFRVGFARSRDGLKWVKFGPVFSGSNGKYAFDALGVTSRYVLRDPRVSAQQARAGGASAVGGAGKEDTRKYVMLYEGVAADGSTSIGLAESNDGMSGWTCLGPVFEPARGAQGKAEGEGDGSGEEKGAGEAGAWDSWSVGSPCLVDLGGGHLRLYYVGSDGRGFQGVGAAESLDGSFQFERCANLESLL